MRPVEQSKKCSYKRRYGTKFYEIFWNGQMNFRELCCNCMYLNSILQEKVEIVCNYFDEKFRKGV